MSNNKQLYIDFEAYERMAEPHKQEKASAWRTAIGLQPDFVIVSPKNLRQRV